MKEEIMKQVKDSIMTDEIFNQDIKNTAKNVKSSEEAVDVVNEMEKIIKRNKCKILWLAYQQGQILQRFKLNDNFINIENKFGISKSTMAFKILIVKYISKYPRMKKIFIFSSSFKE